MIALDKNKTKGGKGVEIKKVGVLSLAKMCAFLYLIPGIILGITIGTEFSRYPPMMSNSVLTWLLNRGAFITYPIGYGIGGFIFGLVGGLFYNFLSRRIGGIEIEIG
jgi:hypothetical protein